MLVEVGWQDSGSIGVDVEEIGMVQIDLVGKVDQQIQVEDDYGVDCYVDDEIEIKVVGYDKGQYDEDGYDDIEVEIGVFFYVYI